MAHSNPSNPNEFEVVYNDKYGGFDISPEGLAEYKKRSGKDVKYAEAISSEDPVLISLVKEMGDKINTKNSKLRIATFSKEFRNFLKWSEYDGKESVCVDYQKYIVYHVKKICDDQDMLEEQKIKQIQTLYQTYQTIANREYLSIFGFRERII